MDNLVNSRIAVIPARGGSKRVPKKNILDFAGKPMIAWTIAAALETELFDKVLVSTDSKEIADIALAHGAFVPFLRSDKVDDFSTISEATIQTLKQLKQLDESEYRTVVQLMANCPLRSAKNITEQVHFFESLEENVSVISGFKYGMFNPWWAHLKNAKGKYEKLLNTYDQSIRSQDLPELICPTGATWISDYSRLIKSNSFYSTGYDFFVMDWMNSIDIDEVSDLKLAQLAYQIFNNENE